MTKHIVKSLDIGIKSIDKGFIPALILPTIFWLIFFIGTTTEANPNKGEIIALTFITIIASFLWTLFLIVKKIDYTKLEKQINKTSKNGIEFFSKKN